MRCDGLGVCLRNPVCFLPSSTANGGADEEGNGKESDAKDAESGNRCAALCCGEEGSKQQSKNLDLSTAPPLQHSSEA